MFSYRFESGYYLRRRRRYRIRHRETVTDTMGRFTANLGYSLHRYVHILFLFYFTHADILLGHCWSSDEWKSPSIPGASFIRPTRHTLCLHGYAVSLRGAHKILRYFRSPDYAYSRPVDHAMKDL